MLTRHQVELIEIPQRMGMVRKNAADIKMAVDAIELSFERDYITTFVLGTGDSDFTPLVHKLRELNRRVIGIGVEASTSALLPPACDEFLFYERLEGVEPGHRPAAPHRRDGRPRARQTAKEPEPEPEPEPVVTADETDLDALVTRTLAGLERSSSGPVLASMLKRAILRKHPTFSEADYGFRTFGELLRNLADRGTVEVRQGSAPGDPEVTLADRHRRRRGGGVRAAALDGRAAREEGPGAPLRAEDPGAAAPGRLQREAVRVRRVPPVRPGGPHPGLRRDGTRSRRRRLHRPTRIDRPGRLNVRV